MKKLDIKQKSRYFFNNGFLLFFKSLQIEIICIIKHCITVRGQKTTV